MEAMEIDVSKSLVARGASSAMGIDSNGDIFYVLRIYAIDSNLQQRELDVVIPKTGVNMFVRVVKSMEAKSE